MVTNSSLLHIATLPEEVKGLRCALFNNSGKDIQIAGLRSSASLIHLLLRTQSYSNIVKQLSGLVSKKQMLSIQALYGHCSEVSIPLNIKSVPEGAIVSDGNVIMTVESTSELFPWLPLIYNDFVQHIETTSTLSTIFYRFKHAWSEIIEKTVDPEKVEVEKQFKLRCDIEPMDSRIAEAIVNAIFPHYPIPLKLEKALQAQVSMPYPPGPEYKAWNATNLDDELLAKNLAILDEITLAKLGYNAPNLASFFIDRFKEVPGGCGIEFPHGVFKEELFTIVAIAKEIAKATGKPFYVKPEGHARSALAVEARSPANGERRVVLSKMPGSHSIRFLKSWLESFSPVDMTINSKGYKVLPAKLLWPITPGTPTYRMVPAHLEQEGFSAEAVDFYIPTNIGQYISRIETVFNYCPVSQKIDDKWHRFDKTPANPTLMFDSRTRRHFTIDPDDVLEADKLDLVSDLKSWYATIPRETLRDFIHAETTKGPLTAEEQHDPLLM